MRKRTRIRQTFLTHFRRFHDGDGPHLHVGNRSYKNYEDFARQTSEHQTVQQTTSLAEFAQASAETQALRNEGIPPPGPEGTAPAKPANPEIPAASREDNRAAMPKRDSFSNVPPGLGRETETATALPRLFTLKPEVSETTTRSFSPNPQTRAAAPSPQPVSDATRNALPDRRNGESAPAAARPESKQAAPNRISDAPLARENVSAAALQASPAPEPSSTRPANQETRGPAGTSPVLTSVPASYGNDPQKTANSAARLLSNAARFSSPNGQPLGLTTGSGAIPAPGWGVLPSASFPPARSEKLSGRFAALSPLLPALAWLPSYPALQGPRVSLLQALEKRLGNFTDLLFGSYKNFSASNPAADESAWLAELGILWMLLKKNEAKRRTESKQKFSSESSDVKGTDENHCDDNPEHGREGAYPPDEFAFGSS